MQGIQTLHITGPDIENPLWHQQFDLRHLGALRLCQTTIEFHAADNCRLYVTTMNAMNFQSDVPSIPVDNFEDQKILVFDLGSTNEASENCHHPELVCEILGLELNFTFLLEYVTEILYWESECLRLKLTSLVMLEKKYSKWKMFLSSK